MALRLIQFILPADELEEALGILRDEGRKEFWSVSLGENRVMLSLLSQSEGTEAIMDQFQSSFSSSKEYRALIIEVLAFTPHPDEDGGQGKQEEEKEGKEKAKGRVSREELYSTLTDISQASKSYIALMILSVLVAAIGIFEDSVAIVIGAAVINPLLGPNMALSLATNLADRELAKRSIATLAIGVAIILVLSLAVGLFLDINPFLTEITSRRAVSLGEIILAVASGSAAALLLTLKASTSLVGVAVAVALLPPLVTFGLLLGDGYVVESVGPMLLFVTDLISINLAGVFTFYIMGVRPLNWWEADRSKRSTAIALIAWAILLAVLAAIIVISPPII